MGTCYTMKFNKKKNDDDEDEVPSIGETLLRLKTL